MAATNVAFVAVVGDDCQQCTDQANKYNSAESVSYDVSLSGSQEHLLMSAIPRCSRVQCDLPSRLR